MAQNENGTYSQLQKLIEKECSKTSFACGGSISIAKNSNAARKAHAQSSDPINLFWVSSKDKATHNVILPESDSESSIKQLASDCTVASFGKGGKDVIDPDYRQAGKLDTTQFASSFHPTDFGLVENIEQILLPDISKKPKDPTCSRKLVSDLYKLNVYSGPSGHFKSHIDTPRDSTQVGSLVVCLPSEFEGGNLLVRHRGQENNFDWSSTSKSSIQWAAFYSDCEHEIQAVTKGHRITLTYNLHLVDMIGGAIRLPKRIVDPESLPPYNLIKSLLEQPGFMAEGGTLGVYCSHAYAHASKTAAQCLPRNLKGSDLVLYSIFNHLGYKIDIRPVLYSDSDESDWDEDEKSKGASAGTSAKVGKKLHPHKSVNGIAVDDYDEKRQMISYNWPYDNVKNIVWLTSPKHREIALHHASYGNEPTLGYQYSYAAILVTIPGPNKESGKESKRRKVK